METGRFLPVGLHRSITYICARKTIFFKSRLFDNILRNLTGFSKKNAAAHDRNIRAYKRTNNAPFYISIFRYHWSVGVGLLEIALIWQYYSVYDILQSGRDEW
jgi:hypothetical protein